ncbi:hypothetical protein NHX12_010042 [Muraenolepis orangiensis]|uniref:FDX-ACB domain-containing protein n=1 Tax=Muraenolepis orangiensis TaxID=630683 RepID=A0A9Q0I8I1_9TELE|nr:hypothetical protein NHX12_010042 [Muraenolepis orangiensis]
MSGPILLVGEGNFSFSAALCQLSQETKLTATCLQRQEDIKHEGAATNIQIIRDSGGAVLFGVDCTKLEECASLRGLVFHRVIFNFPHCGRKSGVKKNRELLKNFFHSCVQVLAEHGEVHVTLCNGQGGTPADKPMREWQNSWQVVAMAAEADLILSSVQPFKSEEVENYRCTGYKSQDKGFHVEEALVHVFTRSPPYLTPTRVKMKEIVGDQTVQDFLCSDSAHPVKFVQDLVVTGLEERCSVSMTTEPLSFLLNSKHPQMASLDGDKVTHCYEIEPLRQERLTCGEPLLSVSQLGGQSTHSDPQETHADVLQLGVKTMFITDTGVPNKSQDGERRPDVNTPGVHKPDVNTAGVHKPDVNTPCVRKPDVNTPGVHRPNLDTPDKHRPDVDTEEGSGVLRFVLRPSLLPQMRVRGGEAQGELETGEGIPFEGPSEGSHCHKDPGASIGRLLGVSGLVFRDVPISRWAQPAFHQLLFKGRFPATLRPIAWLGQTLGRLLSSHGVSVVTEAECVWLTARPMGAVGRVLASVGDREEEEGWVQVYISLNLDLLAVCLFSLPDWRPLWSRDPGFPPRILLLHPSLGEQQQQQQPWRPLFHRPSLFSRCSSFDISFWTGPAVWDDRKLHALAREAGRGAVEQVELIDVFSRQEHLTVRTSYCYRVTYRSHSHALSHTKALELHRQLESLLSSRLHVTIR